MSDSWHDKTKKILERNKFTKIRQNGSHETWSKGQVKVTLATSISSKIMANVVLKQAGIKFRFH